MSRAVEGQPIPLGAKAFALVTLAATAAGFACGGKGENPGNVRDKTTPAQPVATKCVNGRSEGTGNFELCVGYDPTLVKPATLEFPATSTPEATAKPKELKSILNAEFKPTTEAEVKSAIDAAYAAHPEADGFSYKGSTFPRQYIDNNWQNCQKGLPGDAGVPKLLAEDRVVGCSNDVAALFDFYKQTGDELFYQAALSVYRNAWTELPQDKRTEIRRNLYSLGVN